VNKKGVGIYLQKGRLPRCGLRVSYPTNILLTVRRPLILCLRHCDICFCLQQVCWSLLLLGRNVRRPRSTLPPGESQWVCRRDRQTGHTDGRTDARPSRYAFR